MKTITVPAAESASNAVTGWARPCMALVAVKDFEVLQIKKPGKSPGFSCLTKQRP